MYQVRGSQVRAGEGEKGEVEVEVDIGVGRGSKFINQMTREGNCSYALFLIPNIGFLPGRVEVQNSPSVSPSLSLISVNTYLL